MYLLNPINRCVDAPVSGIQEESSFALLSAVTVAFAPIEALSSRLHEVILSKLRSSLRSWG